MFGKRAFGNALRSDCVRGTHCVRTAFGHDVCAFGRVRIQRMRVRARSDTTLAASQPRCRRVRAAFGPRSGCVRGASGVAFRFGHPDLGCVSRCAFGCVRRCAFGNADGKVRSCVRGAFGVRTEFLLRSGRVRERAFGNARSYINQQGAFGTQLIYIYIYIYSAVL